MSLRRLAAAVALCACAAGAARAEPPAAVARRVVSMNPSLTETLLALGAGPRLVGVDEYSARQREEVAHLPRVGGLFNPSLESVVALDPDLVVMVPSAQQRDFRRRLEALGIEVLALPNISLAELLASIEALGARVGRAAAAAERVAAVRRAFAEAEARRAPHGSRPRAVLVLQREPLFAVGRGSFLDAMLRAAGLENAAAEFAEPYPRVSLEWLLAAAPDVLLDSSEDPEAAAHHWARWPSLPAVRHGRVVALPAERVTLPGPHLDRALHTLLAALGEPAQPADPAEPTRSSEAPQSSEPAEPAEFDEPVGSPARQPPAAARAPAPAP